MCLALNATGSVLLHLQWDGRTEQRKLGLSVRTSSPAWSASTSTTFLVSGLDLRGPGVAMAPLLSPILLQGKDVEGGVNRLVVGGSTGICITTAWVSATWLGRIREAGLFGRTTFFFSFPPDADGLRSPQCERSGESALSERREPRYLNRNNTLWWLCAVSLTQDVSAWGTSEFLCFSQTSVVKYKFSEVSHSADLVALICRTLDRQFQLRVFSLLTAQTTRVLTLKLLNESPK